MGDGRQALAAVVEEIGVSEVSAAPYPSPQLVKLRQTELVRLIHNDGIGIGHVQARLDNGGADEDINFTPGESGHYILKLILRHLAVTDSDLRLRHKVPYIFRHHSDALHAVMHKKDLAVTL